MHMHDPLLISILALQPVIPGYAPLLALAPIKVAVRLALSPAPRAASAQAELDRVSRRNSPLPASTAASTTAASTAAAAPVALLVRADDLVPALPRPRAAAATVVLVAAVSALLLAVAFLRQGEALVAAGEVVFSR